MVNGTGAGGEGADGMGPERITRFVEVAGDDADLKLRGAYAPLVSARRGQYRTEGNQQALAEALSAGNVETYKVTWATKLFSPEDVLLVLKAALEGRAALVDGVAENAGRFDCPGPRWGQDIAKGSDPEHDEYEERHARKMYNGGGMVVGLTPMGQLCRIQITAYTVVKLRSGEEREIPLALELEYDGCAQVSAVPPCSLGYLLEGYYVEGWAPQYRNAKLAQVIGELEPSVGVRVISKRVETQSKYVLEVKAASADEGKLNWLRKQLTRGVDLVWQGRKTRVEIGSHMDVEEHRAQRRKEAATYRVAQSRRVEGRQLVIRNIKPEVAEGDGGEMLRGLVKEFCDEGEELDEWVLRTARDGRSAYCWATYKTEEEARRAMQKNMLKVQIIDAAAQTELCWRNDPIVELRGGVERAGDEEIATGAERKWYAKPKAVQESAVPTINVTAPDDPMTVAAGLLTRGAARGELAVALRQVLAPVVDPFALAVKTLTEGMGDWQRQVEAAAVERDAKLREEMAEMRVATAEVVELIREMAGGSRVPKKAKQKAEKKTAARKRAASASESESEEEPGEVRTNKKPSRPTGRSRMEVDQEPVEDGAVALLSSVLEGLEKQSPGLAEAVVKGAGGEKVAGSALWKVLFPTK